MTVVAAGCTHCALSLGRWPHVRDVDGESHAFCCYGCFVGWQVARGGSDETVAVGLLLRLGVGAFLAMNTMLFSLALYAGGLDGGERDMRAVFHYGLFAFSVPTMVVLGGPFMSEACSELRSFRLGASTLVSLGTLSAFTYSTLVTFAGGERVYFDTATMVLVLFTLGRFLEASGRARAMRNLGALQQPWRIDADVVGDDGVLRRVPLAEVKAGDCVRAQPGGRVLVDGVLEAGGGFVDESWVTGESVPAARHLGSKLLAGTLSIDGVLDVRATAAGLDTRWVAICGSLHAALSQPSRLQSLTDRVAAVFVPLVLTVAIATATVVAGSAGWDEAMMRALAVLVVACPCALGLAAPLVMALGIDRMARVGARVRSGDVLLDLATVRSFAFDKTGTLTRGTVRVVGIEGHARDADDALRLAASLEAASRHPVARGIVEAAQSRGLHVSPVTQLRTAAGLGVRGRVDGHDVVVGRATWFEALGWRAQVAPERGVSGAMDDTGGPLLTRVSVGWDDAIRATVVLADEPRAESPAVAQALRDRGLRLSMLSGDAAGPVQRIADRLGLDAAHPGLAPDDKRLYIERQRNSAGPVAFVGDGINDGPALHAANVGIAMHDGVDLAREAADVVLPRSGVVHLPLLVDVARGVRRLAYGNFAWALGYNLVAIALAALGYLQPVVAATLMAGSSLLVIANSLRLERMSADNPAEPQTMRNTACAPASR